VLIHTAILSKPSKSDNLAGRLYLVGFFALLVLLLLMAELFVGCFKCLSRDLSRLLGFDISLERAWAVSISDLEKLLAKILRIEMALLSESIDAERLNKA
jgi:hypothetical protein